jgi:hypothetical protein
MSVAMSGVSPSRGQGSAFPPAPLSARNLRFLDLPFAGSRCCRIAPKGLALRRLLVPRMLTPLCSFHEARLSDEGLEMHPGSAFQPGPTPGGVRGDTVSPAEGGGGRRRLPRGPTTRHPRRSKDDNR